METVTRAVRDQAELDEFYWHTDVATADLQEHFGLPKGRVHEFVSPLPSGKSCPNCGGPLVFASRAGRQEQRTTCMNCTHSESRFCAGRGYSLTCKCEWCRAHIDEERRVQEERRRLALAAEYALWLEERATADYARWAVGRLDRRTRLFYRALVELMESGVGWTWQDVADRAGVVSHVSYWEKLKQIALAHPSPDGGWTLNSSLDVDSIAATSVRVISNSLRFEIFQRDGHTCQYCGRCPPEVELQIDHLLPVARGGTDEPQNLVTSCKECNSGKSDKLIQDVRGLSFAQQTAELAERRSAELNERRDALHEVFAYWEAERGFLSSYDESAIYRWVERYEPRWIMDALDAAKRQQPQNYVKYVSGILRNWGKTGRPGDDTVAFDREPDDRPATPRQLEYVRALLDQGGRDLDEFGLAFDALTRSDVSFLIEELKTSGRRSVPAVSV